MRNNLGGKYQHLVPHSGCACHQPDVQNLTNRVTADLSRRGFLAGMAGSVASLGLPGFAKAQTQPSVPTGPILFTNLRLFDGISTDLRSGIQILVEGSRITALDAGNNPPPANAKSIDCGGRVLMPGLIDAHWHTMLAATPLPTLVTADVGYIHLSASAEAERTLMRGFTTVRDMGGPSFALKKAIDEKLVSGPRIFASGAIISQTAGHGDFRNRFDVPRTDTLTRTEVLGAAAIADGPDEVRRRTREQLMLGASQIKLTAGGGVASLYDPLDATQFRPEEIRAATEAAADWGTYVAVHVYTPTGIKRCIEAGVRCIEHGQLTDEESVQMMVDKDVRWSLQPFTETTDVNVYAGEEQRAKQRLVWEGTDKAYGLAIKHKVKIGWGTDILFDPKAPARQGAMLAAMARWYTPAQVLKMATSGNADILTMSGLRSPYAGKLGVIEKGAYADMLVVDGDPTANLQLLADPANSLRIIMKDGRIYKNAL